MASSSSGNFANNNILIKPVGGTLSLAHNNREISSTSGSWGAPTTMAANTGKWYIEYYVNSGSSGRNVMVVQTNKTKYNQGNYNFPATGQYDITLNSNGSIYNNNDSTATQSGLTALQTGDIMAMALNLDASPKTLQYYRNGTAIGTAENINTSATGHFAFMIMGHNQSTMTINAGQDSSFAGAKSTGTANAADDNGFGNFYYSPPSGFLAMCTGNLPVDENIDPAQTDNDHPQKQFNAKTYTGNGGSQSINVGFQPDLVWVKNRGTTNSHLLFDSSRGATKTLFSDSANAESTAYSSIFGGFTSTGFDLDSADAGMNNSTNNYIAWCWRANGGTTSTNTDGTITSTVQANQAAGFSIMQWTGNGGSNQTIGHGLGGIPDMWIVKNRDASANWRVGFNTTAGAGFASLSGDHSAVKLNNNDAAGDLWRTEGNFTATATTVNTPNNGNSAAFFTTSTNNFIGYCWRSIEGFSKFSLFEGNSDADGPFIYLGFRPRLVFLKALDAAENWQIRDTARNSNTGSQVRIYWNANTAEGTASTASPIDFLANGFKIRGSNSEVNTNTIAYGAWGDVPFKYNNTHSGTY